MQLLLRRQKRLRGVRASKAAILVIYQDPGGMISGPWAVYSNRDLPLSERKLLGQFAKNNQTSDRLCMPPARSAGAENNAKVTCGHRRIGKQNGSCRSQSSTGVDD